MDEQHAKMNHCNCGRSEPWKWYRGVANSTIIEQDKTYKSWLGKFAAKIFPKKSQKAQRQAWLKEARSTNKEK